MWRKTKSPALARLRIMGMVVMVLGATPLHRAVTAVGVSDDLKAAAIQQLLQHGAEIDRKDARGDTALFLASYLSTPRIVRQLLESGANASIRNVENKTPLDVAKEVGRKDNAAVLSTFSIGGIGSQER